MAPKKKTARATKKRKATKATKRVSKKRTAAKTRTSRSRSTKPAAKKAAVTKRARSKTPPRTGSKKENFSRYIRKLIREVKPKQFSKVGMNKKALGMLNKFVQGIFEKVAQEALKIVKSQKKTNLTVEAV